MRFIRDQGWEVTMMSAEGPEINDLVVNEECTHVTIPLTRQITPIQDLKALWRLYKELKRIKPAIVHTHTPKAGLIGMLASYFAHVPVRIHTVAGLPLQTTTGIKKNLLTVIEKITYKCAHEVWPNSRSLFNYISEQKLTSPKKLFMIGRGSTNGINVNEFDSASLDFFTLESIKQQINWNSSNIYLLFVGRVVKDKGIIELVNAFFNVKRTYPNLKLILVGPLEQELDPLPENIIHEITSNSDIYAVGYSNQVKYFMSIANLFVFPSHREGFPNVPMQAGLMNLPVICSDIGGNIDIITHMKTGLLFKVGDSESMTSQILYALDHKEEMNSMSDENKKNIIQNFDRRVVQQKIFEKYLALCNMENTMV